MEKNFRNKRKKNKGIRFLSLFLSVALAGGIFYMPLTGQAKSRSELSKERKQELLKKQKEAEARKSEASENLSKLQSEQKDLENDKNTITDNIDTVRSQIQSAQDKVIQTDADIQKLSEELEDAENQENELHEKIKEQIAISYENSTGKNLLVYILESGSLSEFLNRMEYATSITDYNKNLLKSYADLKETIASKSDKLKEQKQEAETAQTTLAQKQEELSTLLASTNQELDDKAEEVSIASANVDEINSQISGYKAEVQKIETQTAQAQASQVNTAIAEQQKDKAAAEANLQQQENALKQKESEKANLDEIARQKEAERLAAEQAAADAKAKEQAARDEAAKKAAEEAAKKAAAEAEARRQAAQKAAEEAAAKQKELEEQQKKTEDAKSQVENVSKVTSSAGKVYSASAQEVKLLGAICMAEAGNQGYNGMLAVTSVIMNRVYIKKYGFGGQNSITSVVYAKNQFEPVSRKMVVRNSKGKYVETGETVLEYYLNHYDSAVSANAKNAAAAALRGTRYTTSSGAMNQLFFMTPAAYNAQTWFKKSNVCDYFKLSGHVFFNVNA
ncbi:MAG: cell wall hydrolase [Lachnospiraceae bacterium]|nr:cell wall hydrolase [Lachnospiraceae bacterium]